MEYYCTCNTGLRLGINKRKDSIFIFIQEHQRLRSSVLKLAEKQELREQLNENDFEAAVNQVKRKLCLLEKTLIFAPLYTIPFDDASEFPCMCHFVAEATEGVPIPDDHEDTRIPLYYTRILFLNSRGLNAISCVMNNLNIILSDVFLMYLVYVRERLESNLASGRTLLSKRKRRVVVSRFYDKLRKRQDPLDESMQKLLKFVQELCFVMDFYKWFSSLFRGTVPKGLKEAVPVFSSYIIIILEMFLMHCGRVCNKILELSSKVDNFSVRVDGLMN